MKQFYYTKLCRRLFMLFSIGLFFGGYAKAQTSSQYSFSESAGTYTAISGTTSTATGDDGVQDGLPIGFSFVFGGNTYTTFSVTTNGFMKLGSNIVTGTPQYDNGAHFATTTVANSNAPMIAGFWDDNGLDAASGGNIQYLTQGSPGTQTLTVQWTNCAFATGGTGPNITFQIILHEGTNVIDIVYNGISATETGVTATIGINSQPGDYLSITPGTPSTASSTTANNSVDASSTAILTSGTTYTFTPPAGCTTPPVGQTTASVTSICANTSFTLGVTGIPVASGYTYEFQSSPAGANTFTSLGAPQTSPTFTVANQTAATDYKVIIACTINSSSTTATLVNVGQTPFSTCYCTPTSTCTNEGIVNVTMGTLNNTSAMCSGGYSDFTTLGSQVSVVQGQQVAISVTDSINSNPSSAGVWIDYDHSGSFEASEFTFLGSTTVFGGTKMPYTFTGTINIPASALTGVTRMRVRGANSSTPVAASGSYGPCNGSTTVYGEYEDYLITINAGTPCSSLPAGGTLSSSLSSMACPTQFVLSSAGYTSGVTGLSFQWQESTNNINFTNLGSATTDYANDTIPSITQTTYYRLQVTCTNGTGLIAYSDTVTVAFAPISTFPWVYDVETQNTTTNSNITNDCWSSSPSNTTGSYRWDVDASGSTPSSSTGPNSAYSGSKYYYTEASSGAQGDSAKLVSPTLDITSLTVPQLAFFYHMYGSAMGNLIIQVDNGSGWVSLDSLVGQQQTAMTDPWLLKTVDLTGYTGNITVRFVGIRGNDFYGDMSLDDITVRETPSCPAPQTPDVSNETTTTADLDWVEVGTTTQWQVEYGVGNSFAIGTGTREIASSNPHMLGVTTPLTPSTQYTYFVRSICGPNDTSAWSGRSPLFSTLASCDTPTAPVVTNITTTTADLGWTENGGATLWEIEYAQGNSFTIGTGTRIVVNANPYTLGTTTAPLLPGTVYSYYVRSICGANDTSVWSPTRGVFTTQCNPITALPFVETFEPSSPTVLCWSSVDGNNDGDKWVVNNQYPNNGSYSAEIYTDYNAGNNSDWFISPPITLTGNQRLKYWYRARSAGEPNDYTVKLSTLTNDTLDFTNTLKPLTSISNTTYQEDIIDISSFTGTVYLAFHIPAGGQDGWYIFIDDITVEDLPACPDPSALTSANATTTTVDLDWTENGTSTLWEIEYAVGNTFTVGAGTREIVASKPYTLGSVTPLASGTGYSYFVRAICGPNDTSAWSSRGTFATIPVNDDCSGAIAITLNAPAITYDNSSATDDVMPSPSCGSTSAGVYDGMWFSFTAPYTGSFTMSTCTGQNDIYGRIFDGTCGSFTNCIGSGDDDCGSSPEITFSGTMGTTYYILIGNYSGSTSGGTYPISVFTPLSVKLGKLSASNAGASNKIEWNTLSEERTDRFELQRSTDGKSFATIHERAANGVASRYTYMDNNPEKGTNYYRLRMIEANGTSTYSETVSAVVKSNGFAVEAYPNPVSNDLTVKVNGVQSTDATIQVTDVTGKVIKTVTMNGSTTLINMTGLANGIYLIKYSDANHTQIIKVNKQ